MSRARRKKVFWISMIILFVMCAIILWMKYGTYAQYWNDIGGRNYAQIVEKYGEPNEIVSYDYYDELYYDKLIFHRVGKNRDRVDFVVIEDETIRFGILNIGIGSSKTTIRAVYFWKQKLKPETENIIGIMEGVDDVVFEFDEADKVKKIYVNFHG